MKKKLKLKTNVKIIIFFILLCTITIPITFSKYCQKIEAKIIAESTPLYFATTASDLTILYTEYNCFDKIHMCPVSSIVIN